VNSYDTDSTDAMERWQHKLYEISTRICTRITTEVHEEEFGSYQFNGIDLMDTFISQMQYIPILHWVRALNTVLIGVPMQWWEMHQEHLHEWESVEYSIRERFRLGVDVRQYIFSCKICWVAKQ
jgi:hypothetical protein